MQVKEGVRGVRERVSDAFHNVGVDGIGVTVVLGIEVGCGGRLMK